MPLLRYLMLLSLIVWLGGLIFFSFVVAPTVFSVLPTRHLAGSVVSRSLSALHWIGIVSGIVFLTTSMLYSRLHEVVRKTMPEDRKSTRLNSSPSQISYAVFCLKKKKQQQVLSCAAA